MKKKQILQVSCESLMFAHFVNQFGWYFARLDSREFN